MHAHFGVDIQDSVVVMMMKRPAPPYRSPCRMKFLYFGVPFPDGLEVVVDVLKKVNNAMPLFMLDGVEESFEAHGEPGSLYVGVPFENSLEVMTNVPEKANSTMQLSYFILFENGLDSMINVPQKVGDDVLPMLDEVFMLSCSISGWSRGDDECSAEDQ